MSVVSIEVEADTVKGSITWDCSARGEKGTDWGRGVAHTVFNN